MLLIVFIQTSKGVVEFFANSSFPTRASVNNQLNFNTIRNKLVITQTNYLFFFILGRVPTMAAAVVPVQAVPARAAAATDTTTDLTYHSLS